MADKPAVYLLKGDDLIAIKSFIDELVGRMGDPAIASLNIDRLEGRSLNLDALRSTVMTMPFLADRRLVIVNNANQAGANPTAQKRFVELLDAVPQTTALVLILPDPSDRNKDSKKENKWLVNWAAQAGNRAFERECHLPQPRAMAGWIVNQGKKLGGEIIPQAAQALAEYTGSSTSLATRELEKLFTYTDRQRPVTPADVELLVASGGPVDIFNVVDAMAEGRSADAQRLLHNLLEYSDPKHVFALVARQSRLLIQVREMLDEGGPALVGAELKIYYLDKIISQAQRFTPADLIALHSRLLELDEANKTSQMDDELALELLVTGLA